MPSKLNIASVVVHPTAHTAVRLTPSEAVALAPFLDRLHQDDLTSIVGQFRHLAQTARDRRMTGKTVAMPIPGNSEWMSWRGDLLAAGSIVARIRDKDISDAAARAYAEVYLGATEATRVIYIPDTDGCCPALDQLDALEAERESDPAAAW